MVEAELQKIQDAFLRAQALHAVFVGKKRDLTEIEADVEAKIRQAQDVYKRAVAQAEGRRKAAVTKAQERLRSVEEEQQKRNGEAQKAAEQAEADLKAYQNEVRESTGAVIDLLAVPTGGSHTRL